ncbi:MAG: hypothetical protein ABIF22_01870 [bacterium]
MFHVPNKSRIRTHPTYGSDDSIGNNGAFDLVFNGYEVHCIASDGMLWEHVSVTINRKRCPGWEIMSYVKDLFWDEEDMVIQIHPPKSEYVNQHIYCLHLWRPIGVILPLPAQIMVGFKIQQK